MKAVKSATTRAKAKGLKIVTFELPEMMYEELRARCEANDELVSRRLRRLIAQDLAGH